MNNRLIKRYEFWHPRLFELPFYVYLLGQCLLNRISPRELAKANFALDHGEIGIGSKFETQQRFPNEFFLPTIFLEKNCDVNEKARVIERFGEQHGYPLILKPDIGLVGKGIVKIESTDDITRWCNAIEGNYLLQKFTPLEHEWGIFYQRQSGRPTISGINRKHFPTITGNGIDSIQTLAERHHRFTHHWQTFLQYHDVTHIPKAGEHIKLSFIGSHTMGCMFTDDTAILTEALKARVVQLFAQQPGFNFGRIDVKAASESDLLRGDFVVIEVNGVSSLPTHMFDPKYSLSDAYRLFFSHGKQLARIAAEQQHQVMPLMRHRDILRKVITSQSLLEKVHNTLKNGTTKSTR